MSNPCKRGHISERYPNGGGCKQCAREKHKATYVPHPGPRGRAPSGAKARLPDGRRRVDTIEWKMFWGAKNRAQARGIPFTITIEDIKIPEFCPVFGTPIDRPSLDRKINDDGYTPTNIRVISDRANRLKSDATLEEIEAIAEYMRS